MGRGDGAFCTVSQHLLLEAGLCWLAIQDVRVFGHVNSFLAPEIKMSSIGVTALIMFFVTLFSYSISLVSEIIFYLSLKKRVEMKLSKFDDCIVTLVCWVCVCVCVIFHFITVLR